MEIAKENYRDFLGLGAWSLDPRWYSFDEFNWFADKNYFNTYMLNFEGLGTTVYAAKKLQEKNCQFWLATANAGIYFSYKESLSEYMKRIDNFVSKLKENEVWDSFIGFSYDEPLLKKYHTNQDLYDMTKALYEAYGKRNFVCFSGQEVSGKKGNWNDPDGTLILESFATEYISDAGFDSYGYDFRKESSPAMERKYKSLNETYPDIHDAESYYKHYFDMLKDRLVNKDTKIWYFPCMYEVNTWGAFKSDEDYCIAHLKGFTDMLLKEKNPGGMMGYTFKSWSGNTVALDHFLGRNNPNRWERFEEELYNTKKLLEAKR